MRPPWMKDSQNEDDPLEDPWEAERSWRDPSAHHVRKITMHWLRSDRWTNCLLVRVSLVSHIDLWAVNF